MGTENPVFENPRKSLMDWTKSPPIESEDILGKIADSWKMKKNQPVTKNCYKNKYYIKSGCIAKSHLALPTENMKMNNSKQSRMRRMSKAVASNSDLFYFKKNDGDIKQKDQNFKTRSNKFFHNRYKSFGDLLNKSDVMMFNSRKSDQNMHSPELVNMTQHANIQKSGYKKTSVFSPNKDCIIKQKAHKDKYRQR